MRKKQSNLAKTQEIIEPESTGLFGLIDQASNIFTKLQEEDEYIRKGCDKEIELLTKILTELRKINRKLIK